MADGIGTTAVPADVLIDGQVIASVGAGDTPAGCEVIDLAPGSVVCPGFIDAHVHAEGPLLATGRVDGALAQGVTTLVVGTILAWLILPPGLQARGPDQTLAALADSRQRAELLGQDRLTDPFLREVYLGCLPASAAEFAGQRVTEAAARSARPAGEWVLDLMIEAGLSVGGHLDRPTLTDADLAWLASAERHCGGSDGIYQGQHPHPRGCAAFARLTGHYLTAGRESGYQQAARHLAANAADVYGLRDRGRLAPGLAADICVIGPAGLTARASYDALRELAAGVDLVFVNGAVAWRDGQAVTTAFPGQFVS